VGVEDDFFALGGDSILSLQCVARANEAGLRLTPRQMFEHPTVAALAQAAAAAGPLREGPGEDVTFHGPVAPTPIQRWFFEQEVGAIDHYNQAVLLEVREEIDASLVERAVRVVLARHDALWLRFVREGAGWRQFNDSAGAAEVAYRFVDLAGLEESERRRRMDEEAEAAQRGLSLAAGPLARAVYFSLGGGRGARLLVVVHHLAVDGVSWRVLLEDLQRACDQARRGEEIRLPPKTTPFVEWAGRLEEYARSGELEEEFDYWIAQSSPEAGAIPVDYKDGLNTVASARTLTTTLSESETSALLRDVPRAYNTRIDDALLAALCRAYRGWSGSRSLLVDMEGHGREEVLPGLDISRTVGCFTTIYPLLLDSGEADDPGSTLKRVKEKLRGVPRGGIGYGLLKYLGADEKVRERLRGAGRAEISFNYLGQFTQVLGAAGLFAAAKEGAGALRGESGLRSHALGLLGSVNEGRLTLTWSYSENIHARESVEDLAARNLSELRRLIGHCTSGVAGGRAPSDFPLARLDQQTVERLSGPGKAVEDIYPLSPLQEGMLFHELYAPHSGVNIAQFVYSLQSDIDVEVFRRVWQRVVDRHPALRTSFVWEGSEELLQVVHGRVAVPWEELSWVGLSKAEQRERLRSLLRADRERGFDLSVAPLTRLTLIRLSEDSHQLVWSIHHLVGDGWCTSLLLKEVLAFYDAFSRGEDVQLPLPRPYGDYIAWLRRQDLSRAESFWRRTLAGVSAATPLGVKLSARERAEAAGDQPTYDRARLRLPAAATGELQAMARARGLTLNTLVQGAWALLLSRYGGGRDVVFGATVSGRPAELRGVEGMIGLFINTLPVRARVEGGERIGDWLRRLQAEQAEARAFEYSPLARVQDWSGVGRGHSLFDTLLVFENYPVDAALKQPGAKIEVTNIQAVEQTNYPLTLLASVAQELSLQINYDRARFAPPVVERMLEQLSNLLRAMAADPDQRLDDLPMLSARERRQLIEEWNATDVDYERACVHELFERQVERTPDAPALSFEDQSLTYRELDARANQLARRLRRCRVGPEVLVAVMMERSVEMVVSLLAIMKAGGAYVPIDPDYPAERVNFMLDEARVPVLLTQERLVARLREQVAARGVSVLSVDGQREEIARESAERVEGGVGPDNLAYVIYTSGSTGRPKGAMNTHAGVGNRLQWMQDEYGLTGADRVLQKTPYTFDVSAWEFFWPLTCGAQLVVASPGGHRDAAYLRDVIRERGITTLHFVPSMLAVFLEEKGVGQCESLRDVICSGEALPAELARRFSEKLTAARLSNLYGPTEAAIDATFWRCEGVRELEVVPVGRPIANMRAYVLDDRMEPVPAGVTGELYLGGVGLARGYLRGPEMTAGKFVPDPFGGGRGARLYRTGDLARHLADGSVEYVGRTDDQIKLRGYRIELGEIESVLRRHDAVREAAVVLRDDGRGAGKRLAAYFVAEDGEAAPGGDELREHLAAYLPEYMIPAAFVGLGRMPLTANGKLDRAALPEPERVSEEMRRGRVAPQSEEERALAEVWAEVLKLEGVGVNDNFFALGGDSILSIQVVSRAAERGLKLSPRDLFAHQTIAELAAACRPSAPGLAPPQGPVTGHVPLTPIQHWFFERQFNRPHHWNQAVLLGLRRRIEAGVMERAVELLLEHHDALRLRFRKDAGAWRQYNAGREERRVFSEVDLSRLPEEGGERRAAIERAANEAQAGLDLGDGPLVRAVLFETGPRQKLLLVVHHLAVDGVSWRILLEDLQRLCEQLGRGESPRLPPKGTSYKEWAERLELYAQSAEARQSLDYWRRLNWAAVEPLPEDYPGGANTMRSAEVVSVSLDEAQTRLLLQRAPQSSGAQVNDLLLAALVRALQWWRGTSAPVSVEIEGHGREELSEGADVTRTVGWFTSRYPVVLEAGPEADARRALAGVAEQLRRVPRRGVDYGVLRYLSADDEARELLKGHPEPELTFNYLGQLDQIVAEESGALYELAEEGAGDSADKDERREQKLSVNARVVGGRLQVAWGYSRELHRRETIEMVARRYAEELQELIGLGGEAATAAAAPGHVPSLAEGVEIDEALEEVEFE
ncbi:MAG TPA: amino acid adenylation domain-containing protein, partial [Pyrinomonadaceae bacterium]